MPESRHATSAPDAGAGERRTLTLSLTGMTTMACARRIERSLGRLEGVDSHVDYGGARATATFDPGRVALTDLLDAVRAAGYGAVPVDEPLRALPAPAAVPETERLTLRRRALVAALIAPLALLLASVPALQFSGWQWLALLLATPVVSWAAWPLHAGAVQSLRSGRATLDTLASLGLLAAYGFSVVAVLSGADGVLRSDLAEQLRQHRDGGIDYLYFDVVAIVAAILLAARYFELRAKGKAGTALAALLRSRAEHATLLVPGAEARRVSADSLRVGDLVVIAPGEKVPADGVIIDGESALDESLLTGEAPLVDRHPGDFVTGATKNTHGTLTVRITRTGEETTLAKIAQVVRAAQYGHTPVERVTDRIAPVLAPVIVALALLTFVGWLLAGDSLAFAFTTATAVLIVACPCALSLAAPSALLVGTGRGAQLGLLIRGPDVLETTRQIDTVLIGKTGTLTTGRMEVEEVLTVEGISAVQALRLVGAVESGSDHLVGRAIARAAEAAAGQLPPLQGFTSHGGLGASAIVADREVLVGRMSLLAERGFSAPVSLATALATAERRGRTAVAAGWYGEVRAVVVLADPPKPGSARAIERLKSLGLQPLLVTGDNRHAALTLAEQVGIGRGDVLAEMLPAAKAETVNRLRGEGRIVAVVGDGLNDAPALASADLGIAVGTGTDLAVAAGDLTVISGDPGGAADAIELSRRTLRTIKQGVVIALALTLVMLPAAVAGIVSPLLAGFVLAGSSVLVVLSALRLRRFRPSR